MSVKKLEEQIEKVVREAGDDTDKLKEIAEAIRRQYVLALKELEFKAARRWRIGDTPCFVHKGQRKRIRITALNQRTVSGEELMLSTDALAGMKWRVGYEHLVSEQ